MPVWLASVVQFGRSEIRAARCCASTGLSCFASSLVPSLDPCGLRSSLPVGRPAAFAVPATETPSVLASRVGSCPTRRGGMCAGFALDIPLSREALVVPAASRVRCAVILTRSVLGLRPVLRVRPPVTPLTRLTLENRMYIGRYIYISSGLSGFRGAGEVVMQGWWLVQLSEIDAMWGSSQNTENKARYAVTLPTTPTRTISRQRLVWLSPSSTHRST